jgi:THAP domain
MYSFALVCLFQLRFDDMPGHANKCFVPGCVSGYKTCKVKASMFTPPTDPDLLIKWQRAIPRSDRVLTMKDRVCELHFDSKLIERKYSCVIAGKIVELDRGRPTLRDNAVPHVFPNLPSYLTKQITNKRKQRTSSVTDSQPCKKAKNRFIPAIDSMPNESELTDHITFTDLCQQSAALCPPSWSKFLDDHCLSFCKLAVIDGQGSVVCSVNITEDMNFTVFYMGRQARIQLNSNICTPNDLSSVFRCLEELHACPGNGEEWLKDVIKNSRVAVREKNTWRHVCCSRLTKKERCVACSNFRRVLQTVAARKRVHAKVRKRALHLRTIDRLRKRIHTFRALSLRLKSSIATANRLLVLFINC